MPKHYGVGTNYEYIAHGGLYSTGCGVGYGSGSGTGRGHGGSSGGYGGSCTGLGSGAGTGDSPSGGYDYTHHYTVSQETPIIAYHYVRDDMYLHNYHLGKEVRVDVGTVLEVDGEPELCRRGLHASLTPEDARRYASGVLTRVECSGHIVYGSNKLACTRRKVVEVIK